MKYIGSIIRKGLLLSILFIYICDIFGQSFLYYIGPSVAQAASPTPHTDIVSMIVDTRVYDQISDDIERYATQYIQAKHNNTKVLVIPIDTSKTTIWDIYQINQNLFLEGNVDKPSSLVGTILIGDISMPVVRDGDFDYVSIYPYTDFVLPSFVRNSNTKIFETSPNKSDQKADIWHSIIRFPNISDYNAYFQKLKKYNANPSTYVTSASLWYDDFVSIKKTFQLDKLRNYIYSNIFSEDLNYNRYTNLLVDMLNIKDLDTQLDKLDTFVSDVDTHTRDDYYIDSSSGSDQRKLVDRAESMRKAVQSVSKILGINLASSSLDEDNGEQGVSKNLKPDAKVPNAKYVPTMLLQPKINSLIPKFNQLYASEYYDIYHQNLIQSQRYNIGSGVSDSSFDKVTLYDQMSSDFLRLINDKLEKALDQKIEQEKYYLRIPIQDKFRFIKRDYEKELYETFFRGTPSKRVVDASDISIYRGTFNNIYKYKLLEDYNLSAKAQYIGDDISSEDIKNKSIGSSYGVSSRETESHRGRNRNLVEDDLDERSYYKDKYCKPGGSIFTKKNMLKNDFMSGYGTYGLRGYTPYNLKEGENRPLLDRSRMTFNYLRNPSRDPNLGGPVYDVAGSKTLLPDRSVGSVFDPDAEISISSDEDENTSDDNDSTAESYPSMSGMSLSGISDSYLAISRFGFNSLTMYKNTKLGQQRFVNICIPRALKKRNKQKPYMEYSVAYDRVSKPLDFVNQIMNLISVGRTELDPDDIRAYFDLSMFKNDNKELFSGKTINTIDEASNYHTGLRQILTGGIPGGGSYTYRRKYIEAGLKNDISVKIAVRSSGTNKRIDKGTDKRRRYEYYYRTIDSRTHHKSPSIDQIAGIRRRIGPVDLPGQNDNTYFVKGYGRTIGINDRTVADMSYAVKFAILNQQFAIDISKIRYTSSSLSFSSGTNIYVYGKSYDLSNKTAILSGDGYYYISGIDDRIGAMNMTTLDRPIDSARYLNFKGIGGDKVDMYYPNIWLTSIYTGQDTQIPNDIDSIKKNIYSYLRDRVRLYNISLKNQLDKSSAYYNSDKDAYDRIGTIDKYASPARSYDLLDPDFLINNLTDMQNNLTSDDVITIIAYNLYYQNLMRKYGKQSKDKILEERESLQSYADINQKIGYIVHRYTDQNRGTGSDGKQILQNYRNGSDYIYRGYNHTGYEAGFINSDGEDYIQDTRTPNIISQIDKTKIKYEDKQKTIKQAKNNEISECAGVDYKNSVSLKLRPDALKCRWIAQKNKYSGTGSKKLLEFYVNDQQVTQDSLRMSRDHINQFFVEKKYKSLFSGLDDKITKANQYLGFGEFVNQLNNSNTLKYGSMDTKQAAELSRMMQYIQIYQPPQLSVDGDMDINISTASESGNFDIYISYTGSNCLAYDNKSICNNELKLASYSFAQISGSGKVLGKLSATKDDIGRGYLIYKICLPGSNYACHYVSKDISIISGLPKTIVYTGIELLDLSAGVARGSQIPIEFRFLDSKNNQVSYSDIKYNIATKYGKLIYNGWAQTGFTFNELDNLVLIYDSDEVDQSRDYITITPTSDNEFYPDNILDSLPKKIIPINIHNPIIKTSQDVIDYRLADSPEQNTGIYINLDINNSIGQNIYAIAQINCSPSACAKSISSMIFTGSSRDLYILPNTQAGSYDIQISVGSISKTIKLNILPSSPVKLAIVSTGTVLKPGENKIIDLNVLDIYGNLTEQAVNVVIGVAGQIYSDDINPNTQIVKNIKSKAKISIIFKDNAGGVGHIYASITGSTLDTYGDHTKFTIQNTLWSKTGMDIMYLTLFGNDRANIWSRDLSQSHTITDIINLGKTLAITSQTANPKNIYKSIIDISSNASIYARYTDVYMENKDGYIGLYQSDIGFVPMISSEDIVSMSQIVSPSMISNQGIYYLPTVIDSSIPINILRGNKIIIGPNLNDAYIYDLQNGQQKNTNPKISIKLSSIFYKNHNVRDVYIGDRKVGELYMSISNILSKIDKNKLRSSLNLGRYDVYDSYIGSTSSPTISIVDKTINMQSNKKDNANIGFANQVDNITQFANGMSVGEATENIKSTYTINFGDPYISRIQKNFVVPDTNFDQSVGQLIYRQIDGDIYMVKDFNRDGYGLKELLLIYKDGKIKLLKNNGNKSSWQDMGYIAHIYDGIQNLRVGDSDGNGLDDIIIRSSKNFLRVFKNIDTKIDVDGNMICLNISSGTNKNITNNLKDVTNIELLDYDNDAKIDIVTYDKYGYLKVFYGGRTMVGLGSEYYISNISTGCDSNILSRLASSEVVLDQLGLSIDKNLDIARGDTDSLINWGGLSDQLNTKESKDLELDLATQPEEDGSIDQTSTPPLEPNLNMSSKEEFQSEASSRSNFAKLHYSELEDKNRYISVGGDLKPIYDNSDTNSYYISPANIDTADPVSISKNFVDINGGRLMPGDDALVKISIYSKSTNKFSYIERLNGPWTVEFDDNSIRGIQYIGNSGYVVDYNNGGYLFNISNIDLPAGSKFEIIYRIKYNGASPIDMHISHRNKSTSDFKVAGEIKEFDPNVNTIYMTMSDGCRKNIIYYSSSDGRHPTQKTIDLDLQTQKQKTDNYKNYISGANQIIKDIEKNIDDYILENWNQNQVLGQNIGAIALESIINSNDGWKAYGEYNLNDNTSVQKINQIVNKGLNKYVDQACQGFRLNNAQGSNRPFSILSQLPSSMAFLSPGTQNFMGCKLFYDKGLPILSFPTDSIAGFQFMTLPAGPQGGGGWYGGNVSQFRLYISPTTTAQLGIAMCFGPESLGKVIPPVIRDIAGNCLVMAVDPFAKKNKSQSGSKQVELTNNQAKTNYCDSKLAHDRDHPGSPLLFINQSNQAIFANSKDPGTVNIDDGLDLKYVGYADGASLSDIVNAVIEPDSAIPIMQQIKTADTKGLFACIVNKRADNQIQYISNNLTNFGVKIVMPDIGSTISSIKSLRDPKSNSFGAKSILSGLTQNMFGFKNIYDDYEQIQQQQIQKPEKVTKLKGAIKLLDPQNLYKINNYQNNPLDDLKEWMNAKMNINIDQEDIYIDIPWIYTQDINNALQKLEGALSRTTNIPIQIQSAINDLKAKGCTDAICTQKLQNLININVQYGQFRRTIIQNINTLKSYGELRKEVTQIIDLQNDYLVNIYTFVNEFVLGLTRWISKTSYTLAGYMDAGAAMLNAIKTRQLFIDISVNFKSQCSKCTVDNYSYYSCGLRGFCPNFPIIKIPPFKIPNLIIDLSQVSLDTNITLPRLRFRPKKIDISPILNIPHITIPDLKINTNANVNISIPQIPLLPPAPDLGSIKLPDFIPSAKWDLPDLPPAPRVPNLSPDIVLAIDMVDFVGQIWCRIKGGIGLVGEKTTKQKIEQLTQRTWEVDRFDKNKITIPDPAMSAISYIVDGSDSPSPRSNANGFDYQIKGYLDMKLKFDDVYDIVNGIASNINSSTNQIVKDINAKMYNRSSNIQQTIDQKIISPINDKLQNTSENLQDKLTTKSQEGIDGLNKKIDGLLPNNNLDMPNINIDLSYTTGNTKYISHQDLNHYLKTQLAYIKNKSIHVDEYDRILAQVDSIYADIEHQSTIQTNISKIQNIQHQAQDIINSRIQENQKTKNQIKNNYDQWLKSLDTAQYINSSNDDIHLSTAIWTADQISQKNILQSDHPIKSYLSIQKQLIDGYLGVLQNEDNLAMSHADQYASTIYLSGLSQNISNILDNRNIQYNLTGISISTNPSAHNTYINRSDGLSNTELRLADTIDDNNTSNTNTSSSAPSSSSSYDTNSIEGYLSADETKYLRGFPIYTSGDETANIIDTDDAISILQKNNYLKIDINQDGAGDLLYRHGDDIYIKYQNQNDIYPGVKYSSYYKLDTMTTDTLSQLKDGIYSKGFGFMGIFGIEPYKIYSPDDAIYDLDTVGQSWDSLSYSFDNKYSAYILRYSDSLADIYKTRSNTEDMQYMLILSNDTLWSTQDNLYIHDDIDDSIGDLLSQKKIQKILSVDASEDIANIVMTELPKKRIYSQVSKLSRDANSKSWYQSSARSHQANGGIQTVAKEDVYIIPDSTNNIGDDKNIITNDNDIDNPVNNNPKLYYTNTGKNGWNTGSITNGYNNSYLTGSNSITGNNLVGQGKYIYANTYTKYDLQINIGSGNQACRNLISTGSCAMSLSRYGCSQSILDIKNIYCTAPEKLIYIYRVGDKYIDTVSLDIRHSDIRISDTISTGILHDIVSNLSKPIDDGSIKFQKLSGDTYIDIYSVLDKSLMFPVSAQQTTITGGSFRLDNSIGVTDGYSKVIAVIRDDGYIHLIDSSNYSIQVSIYDTKPFVSIYKNTNPDNILHKISLDSKSIANSGIVLQHIGYVVHRLGRNNNLGDLDGGYCIAKIGANTCAYTVDLQGNLRVLDANLKVGYEYISSAIRYNIYESTISRSNLIGSIDFSIK